VFNRYDYGMKGNMKEYNSKIPPSYNLSNFINSGINTAIFAAGHDDLVSSSDLEHFLSLFPTSLIKYNNYYDEYSHVTWMVSDDTAFGKWGNDVLTILNNEVGRREEEKEEVEDK